MMTNLDKIAEVWAKEVDCEKCPLRNCPHGNTVLCSRFFAEKITDTEWLDSECEK